MSEDDYILLNGKRVVIFERSLEYLLVQKADVGAKWNWITEWNHNLNAYIIWVNSVQ
jgi:hypothetical protein